MAKDLKSRYQQDDVKKLLLCAAFLDPRLKSLDFITYSDPEDPDREVSDEEKKKWITDEKKRVKAEMRRRMVSLHGKPQACAIKSEPANTQGECSPALPTLLPDGGSHPSTSEPAANDPPSKKMKSEPSYFDDFFSDIMITKVEPALSPMDRA